MKRFFWGALSLVAMAAPALAADLPVKAPPPPVIPMYNWSGFYIGGNGGWGQADDCWNIFVPVAGPIFATLPEGCHNKSGGVAGGQIGYRLQLPGNHFVWGIEAQGDWANLNASRVSALDRFFTLNTKVDGIGLFTTQLGFAWDTWLVYVKGGAAVTSNQFDVVSTIGGIDLATDHSTRWGGALGVGFEYGFTPNWSVGLEYDHLFMGSQDFACITAVCAGVLSRVTQDLDMVTVRFNYRFGGYGAPLVARY
jgi:outer membrane immunogenic protein